jgi:hypothetical protein
MAADRDTGLRVSCGQHFDDKAVSVRCRLQQGLLAEAPEKAVEAASLLLDLAELLLNAFAAAVSLTADASTVQRLVSEYGAARQEILQDALNSAVAVCTRGAPSYEPQNAIA